MKGHLAPAGLRRRLLLAVVAAVGAAVVVLTLAFNLVLHQRLAADADDALRAHASAELGTLAARGRDGLRVREAPDDAALDSQIWVFARTRALERPRTSQQVDRAANRLAAGPRRLLNVAGTHTRLYVLPVVEDGRRLGTVVAGLSLEPYERTERFALVGSLALGALLLLAVVLASRWALAAALRPVARMTSDAADWSEHDLDRRFELGDPHDELTQLAATLDGLLDRLAASLRHEQRFSAEISHELRTPLARIAAEAELALRQERPKGEYRSALEAVQRDAEQMSRMLETLVAAAREDSRDRRGTADARAAALAAAEACSAVATIEGVAVSVADTAGHLRVGTDADVVERILAPLIENGCRYGDAGVRIGVARAGRVIRYSIDDDGAGVASDEDQEIFEPGRRGSAAGNGGAEPRGAGLGLALSRRLARAAGGEVEVARDGPGGHFRVTLPAV